MCNLFDRIKKVLNPPKRVILVIDDAVLDRTFVSRVLTPQYNVVTAEGAQAGIEAARQHKPDLILLDYMMPGMKGPDVCRVLKEDEKTRSIPVIFLTSMDDVNAMSDSFEGGAENYLTKPIGKVELLSQIKLRLKPEVYN